MGNIVDYAAFVRIRPHIKSTLVLASGGFDPIHPGHTSYLRAASMYGDLVVLVNGDWFLTQKKGAPFMDLDARCQIVSSIEGVSWVIPYEVENMTVINAIREIHPDIFVKGGDRCGASTIPEWDACWSLDIPVLTGIGYDKKWSSSDYLKKWDERSRT